MRGVVGGGKDASWPKSGDKAEIERPGHAVTPEFRQVSLSLMPYF